MFHVGQKVVCVDASEGERSGKVMLTLNAVYTISEICAEVRFGERGVFVAEISRKISRPGFKARRFRPAVEKKTDISIFKEMLVPQRELALSSHQRETA